MEIHKSAEFRAEVNEVLDRPYTSQVTVHALPEYLAKFVERRRSLRW